MLPTLTLQIDDLKGGFSSLSGSQTYGQPLGTDFAGTNGEAPTSFAALLPTPDLLALTAEGGPPLPLSGNPLPAGEGEVPVERPDGEEQILLAEISNPTSLELRLFSDRPENPEAVSREASLAALAVSPLRPASVEDTHRASLRRDNYELLSGREMPIRPQTVGSEAPVDIKPVVDQALRVPTLSAEAGRGEWSALREAAFAAAGANTLGDSASVPAALKALQASAQPAPQPLASMAPPPAGAPAAPSVQSMTISVPVQDGSWSDALSQRVTLLTGGQQTSAEIRLTPAELGPIRVSVAMEDGAANVTFSAQHSVTREAIETALPRLRELLTENGLSLGHASVSDHSARHGQESDRADQDVLADIPEIGDDDERPIVPTTRAVLGLVDTFV